MSGYNERILCLEEAIMTVKDLLVEVDMNRLIEAFLLTDYVEITGKALYVIELLWSRRWQMLLGILLAK